MPLIPAKRTPVRRRRPARPTRPPADPFAPLSEQAIRARATADVRSQVDPILADIRSGIQRRTEQGSRAITGYTNTLAEQLGWYEGSARDIYGRAASQQAAADNALRQMLAGQGGDLAAQLAGTLPAAGVADVGQGAANAAYARGAATLGQLLGTGAAEQAYAAKQPGIARLAGQQQLGTLQRQSLNDLQEQTGAVTRQIPGLISDLVRGYRGQELDKAQAREARRISDRDFAFDTRVFEQGVLGDQAELAARGAEAAADAARPDASLSRVYGHVVDSQGNPILRAGRPVPVARTPARGRGGTQEDRRQVFYDVRGDAFDAARRMFKGEKVSSVDELTGERINTVKRPPYGQVFSALMAEYGDRLINQHGFTRRAVQQMIRKALTAAGFKAPRARPKAPPTGATSGGEWWR